MNSTETKDEVIRSLCQYATLIRLRGDGAKYRKIHQRYSRAFVQGHHSVQGPGLDSPTQAKNL